MRRVSAFGLLIVLNVLTMYAQRFDDKFSDRTLRIDYIFSGNANAQQISVDELRSAEGWYGRRCNLDKLLLRGNG
ncbi:MAG: peptidase M64 N-terminal domain-containing protein, partial [Bacteroidaceae bacterium]|nr:peptidase M64 N-terminal domain-containing protein [Bacteroidaceae bacterium]